MSSQRVTAAVAAEDRSAHPAIRGVPWWAAIVIAVAATLAGCAIDAAAGNRELTGIFATFYVVGCVVAVLAVRHTGIFTAVVQPPLILFVTIPGAYFLLHRAEIAGVKDLVINCFYPLIERFLLMLLTALVVLAIGAARWYFESAKHQRTAGTGTTLAAAGDLLAGLRSQVRGLISGDGGEPRPKTSGRAPRKQPRNRTALHPPRPQRPAGQAATRSRHARPPMDDPHAPVNPPRRRPAQTRDLDRPAEPPRRRRAPRDPDHPREPSRLPPTRAADHPDRPLRTSRRYGGDAYDPFELYGTPAPPDGAAESHLPFSNVRYRGGDTEDDSGYRRPRR